MRSTYGEVLRLPGAVLFSLTGLVSRLPLSMSSLGIVLLVRENGGSYAAAGLLAAAHVGAAAVAAPLQGRLADRWGQRVVLVVVGAAYGLGMVATIAAISELAGGGEVPPPWPHLAAAAAGLFVPQTGSFVRARWTHALRDRRPLLTTAFAIEAVLDEVVFVVGPVLVTFLTLQVLDVAGLATATAAAVLGSWALAAQTGSEPPREVVRAARREPMGWPVLAPVLVAAVGIGTLFGSAEVIVVAFTEQDGVPGAAGAVLAVWAGGSLLAGVVVGALPAPRDPVRRLRWSVLVLGALFAPLLVAPGTVWLTAGMFLAGVMISPTMISATSVIELHVPRSRLTEALTWTTTGLAVGVAPGAALAGAVVDEHGASAAFLVPLVAGLAAAVVAWAARLPAPPAERSSEASSGPEHDGSPGSGDEASRTGSGRSRPPGPTT